jgi:hypothetical protein
MVNHGTGKTCHRGQGFLWHLATQTWLSTPIKQHVVVFPARDGCLQEQALWFQFGLAYASRLLPDEWGNPESGDQAAT